MTVSQQLQLICWSTLTFSLFVAAAAAPASPQDQAKAIENAGRYAAMFGLPFDAKTASVQNGAPGRRSKAQMVTSGETFIALDGPTGRLRLATDGSRESSQRPRPVKASLKTLPTSTELWARAEKMLAPLGLPSYLKRDVIRYKPDRRTWNGKTPGRVILKFYATVNGYPSAGNGNKAIVTFDTRDLAVIVVEVSQEWTYGPATRKITEAAAVSTASRVMKSKGKPKVTIGYVQPSPDQSDAKPFFDQRQCRLSYSVHWPTGAVVVDANTGHVIASYRF